MRSLLGGGYDSATVIRLREFVKTLSANELDELKFRTSLSCRNILVDRFRSPADPLQRDQLVRGLRILREIQPYLARVPVSGVVYFGRPQFMSDSLLDYLSSEAAVLRPTAQRLFQQMISRVDNLYETAVCEKFAAGEEMYNLVSQYAGRCVPSYVNSYIYYDSEGECSQPHVDNAFTSITAMVGLNPPLNRAARESRTIFFSPDDGDAVEYDMNPGEILIFFGSCTLHGRTPVREGEKVYSLLTSFRPI